MKSENSNIEKAVTLLGKIWDGQIVHPLVLFLGQHGKSLHAQVRDQEKLFRQKVDGSCRMFCSHGTWGINQDAPTQIFIYARLIAAKAEAVTQLQLLCEGKRQDAESVAAFLETVLVDHWHQSVREIWPARWFLDTRFPSD